MGKSGKSSVVYIPKSQLNIYLCLPVISAKTKIMGPKRNVAFIKPEEPNFLKKIKQEIGYKEPDTVEAKVCGYLILSESWIIKIILFILACSD